MGNGVKTQRKNKQQQQYKLTDLKVATQFWCLNMVTQGWWMNRTWNDLHYLNAAWGHQRAKDVVSDEIPALLGADTHKILFREYFIFKIWDLKQARLLAFVN